MTESMYNLGYIDGRNNAILCCLGNNETALPYFETPNEERDYFDGYEAGYGSID